MSLHLNAAQLVLRWPRSLLLVLLALLAGLSLRLPQLEVDVSARTLLPADYPALRAWRDTVRDFHLPEQLMVTVASPGDLLNATTRALLEQSQTELAAVPGVVAH